MTTTLQTPPASSESAVDRVALDATRFRLVPSSDERQPAAPDRLLVVPWGAVHSAAGDFTVDEESAALTIAAFRQHGTDLPVDYEHQTLGGAFSSPNGQAPAAGWITGLHAVTPDDAARQTHALSAGRTADEDVAPDELAHAMRPGIWADVSWTDEGRRHVVARQYRYLSPVALVRRNDRRLIGLHSVALTNKPAIAGMTPVVNRQSPATKSSPDTTAAKSGPDAINDLLMIEETHRPGRSGQSTSSTNGEFELTTLRNVLQLDESAEPQAIVTAAVGRLRALEHAECRRAAADRVGGAFREGKLTTPQRDWAFELAMRDPVEFDRWRESAPVVVPLGRIASHTDQPSLDSRAVEIAARAEWRANRGALERLCTEDAYAAAAVRSPA